MANGNGNGSFFGFPEEELTMGFELGAGVQDVEIPVEAVAVAVDVPTAEVLRDRDAGFEPEPVTRTVSDRLRDLAAGIPAQPAPEIVTTGVPDFSGVADLIKTGREITQASVGFLGDVAQLAVGVRRLFAPTQEQTQVPVPRSGLDRLTTFLFSPAAGIPLPFVGSVSPILLLAGGAFAVWAFSKKRR